MGADTSKFGFQIGRVVYGSPAYDAGLLPFFDFITGVDGQPIAERPGSFFREHLKQCEGKQIQLEVYNTKVRSVRTVVLVPTSKWGGQGLLGCSINWEDAEKAQANAWHVLDLQEGGHAAQAGLQAYRDYIIGMQAVHMPGKQGEVVITMFSDGNDFHRRLQALLDIAQSRGSGCAVMLLVFDSVSNEIREVSVKVPLACDVGNGYLHSIPNNRGDLRLPTLRLHPPNPASSQSSLAPAPQAQPLVSPAPGAPLPQPVVAPLAPAPQAQPPFVHPAHVQPQTVPQFMPSALAAPQQLPQQLPPVPQTFQQVPQQLPQQVGASQALQQVPQQLPQAQFGQQFLPAHQQFAPGMFAQPPPTPPALPTAGSPTVPAVSQFAPPQFGTFVPQPAPTGGVPAGFQPPTHAFLPAVPPVAIPQVAPPSQ